MQGVVEEACQKILRMTGPIGLTVAGRTDAGVHAQGQVAHIDITQTAWQALPGRGHHAPEQAFVRRMNAVLPGDVVIKAATPVPDVFDARFSALWRGYSYRIIFFADPLLRRFAVHHEQVDLAGLNAASDLLLGERDFGAFCKARPGATTIRTLQDFTWRPWSAPTGTPGAVARVQADAFCHHMVRSLVGACLMVASGKRSLEWLTNTASQTTRSSEVKVAPARGLVLEQVAYPDADQLAAQARASRRIRSLG